VGGILMQILIGSRKPAFSSHKNRKNKSDCVVLIGMAGVGKSTIGKSLSKNLGFEFIDLDDYIVEKSGLSLQDTIDYFGEGVLLKLERDSAYEIGLKHKVIAPGGSIAYNPDVMKYLGERSTLVYLKDDFGNIHKRIKNQHSRGIIGLKNKSLREVYEERIVLYNQYADITVDCKNKTKNKIIKEITSQLN